MAPTDTAKLDTDWILPGVLEDCSGVQKTKTMQITAPG